MLTESRSADIYTRANPLADNVYNLTRALQRSEIHEESVRLRRTARSIFGNIVRGYEDQENPVELHRHFHHALQSFDRTLLHLGILYESHYLRDKRFYANLSEQYATLGHLLNEYIRTASTDNTTPATAGSQGIRGTPNTCSIT